MFVQSWKLSVLQEEAAPAPAEEEAPVKEKKEKKKVVFDAEDSANVEDIDLESFGKKKKKKKREGLEDLNDVKEALPEDDDDDIDLENFGKKKKGGKKGRKARDDAPLFGETPYMTSTMFGHV